MFTFSNEIYWYVIFTKPRCEEKAKKKLEKLNLTNLKFCNPKRAMHERKNSRIHKVVSPVYARYLFCHGILTHEIYNKIVALPEISCFIKNESGPIPLTDCGVIPLLNISLPLENNIINESLISLKDGELFISSGPLVGLESFITRTQLRRQRVFVDFSIYGNTQTVSLPANFLHR